MPRYLTPAILRASGTGLPLSTISDADLAGLIAGAETEIDTFMGFDEASGLGFSPGTRTEKHPWNPTTRRVYPFCAPVPVKSVTSYAVETSQQAGTGAPVQATIDPTLVVINNSDGYIETVSLVTALGLLPLFTTFSLFEPFVNLTYTAGYEIALSGRLLYAADTRYTRYHALLPFWDTTAQTPIVSVNGVVQASGYTVDATNGTVTFTTPQVATDSITATFTTQIPEPVVQACRYLVQGRVGDYVANQNGMVGVDELRDGSVTRKRHDHTEKHLMGVAGGIAPLKLWQTLLLPLKTARIGS